MRASPAAIQTTKLTPTRTLLRQSFPLTRTRICFPRQRSFCHADSEDGSFNVRTVDRNLVAAEKEEAKAVLNLFFKKLGLSIAVAKRTINTSEHFIEHLISKLHSAHKTRYLVGRELSTLEIRDTLIPYLESLLEQHGDIILDVVEKFPDPPGTDRPKISPPPVSSSPTENIEKKLKAMDRISEKSSSPNENIEKKLKATDRISEKSSSPNENIEKRLKAMDRISEKDVNGELPPQVIYLLEVGLELEQIQLMAKKFPAFAYYSLEGKIKPIVEFLLDLGISQTDIPTILSKRPQLCGISLTENIIPTMKFLENLGVDKEQWAKVIYRFPALLTYSRQKVISTVDFLYEFGVTAERIGKILTRCPQIISYSVEDNLRPTADYFQSLGVDVGILIHRAPQAFGLSIEANLKPITEFFLEKGYTIVEVGTMVSRYAALYTFSLEENIIPKWEYFLTMDYPNSELVKFPQFFGYSLEGRIKPRYALVKESGAKLLLNQVLSLSGPEFQRVLKKKVLKKMLHDQTSISEQNVDDLDSNIEE